MNLQEAARRMAPSLSRGIPFVYILRLRSGNFYVGCSTDFEARFREHEQGTACRTTAINPAKTLLFIEIEPDFGVARRRESQIKRWSRAKKLALINGDHVLLQRLSRSRERVKSSRSSDGLHLNMVDVWLSDRQIQSRPASSVKMFRALLLFLLLTSANVFAANSYTQKLFWRGLGGDTDVIGVSSYMFVLITLREPNASQRVVAIPTPDFLDAILIEHHLKGKALWAKAIQIALNQPGRTFSFSNARARRLVQPGYSPETLEAMRKVLSRQPRSALVAALKTRSRRPIDIDALYDGSKPGRQSEAYEAAVAHVYLERGILVGHLDYSGGLFVAED